MRIKCIKSCKNMVVGEIGEFKALRTLGRTPIYHVVLNTGVTVQVPVSACEIIKRAEGQTVT